MQPPIIGTWQIRILAVRPYTIHSDAYYEVSAEKLGESDAGSPVVLRVPQHACAIEPTAGQRAEVTFLMGQVTKLALTSTSEN